MSTESTNTETVIAQHTSLDSDLMSIFGFEQKKKGEAKKGGRTLFDTNGSITALGAHLGQNDTYKLTGDALLNYLRDHETTLNLITASAIEAATEAESQGLPARQGCKDLAVLSRSTLKLAPEDASRRSRLVKQLPSLPKTRETLHAGVISARHAQIIADTMAKVPADKAEKVLCRHALRLNPRQLMYPAKITRATLDPDSAYRDEKEGIAKQSVKMGTNEHGYLHLIGSFAP